MSSGTLSTIQEQNIPWWKWENSHATDLWPPRQNPRQHHLNPNKNLQNTRPTRIRHHQILPQKDQLNKIKVQIGKIK